MGINRHNGPLRIIEGATPTPSIEQHGPAELPVLPEPWRSAAENSACAHHRITGKTGHIGTVFVDTCLFGEKICAD